MELSGKNVLLTGGSRGLGPVIAEALARRGAHLALAARSEEGLRRTADSLRPHGVRVIPLAADLGSAADRARLVERALAELGSLDVLVNNAGLENDGPFLDLSWEQIAETIEVNLAAPVHLTHLVLPHMLERKRGHVVQISSLAGRVNTPYHAVYGGTKAGLTRWSQGVLTELEGTGVKLSTVHPGYVREQGMFARAGMRPPRLAGSCTPAEVAAAVVKAVEEERPELLVNSMPMRPLMVLGDVAPGAVDWLLKRVGVRELQLRKSAAPPGAG